jgi:hypothetical protein
MASNNGQLVIIETISTCPMKQKNRFVNQVGDSV